MLRTYRLISILCIRGPFLGTIVIFVQYSTIFLGAHSLDEENVRAVERSCEVLNAYLGEREYVAGDTLTIADFAIHTTICVLLASILVRYTRYNYLASSYLPYVTLFSNYLIFCCYIIV